MKTTRKISKLEWLASVVLFTLGLSVGYSIKKCSEVPAVCHIPEHHSAFIEGEWEKGFNILDDRLKQCNTDLIKTAEDCSAHLICKDIDSISY